MSDPTGLAMPPLLPRGVLVVSVLAVWAVALALGILIGILSRAAAYASWLSLALGVCVLIAFVAQLSTQQKDGFVNRLAAALTGSFVILGATGAVLAISIAGH